MKNQNIFRWPLLLWLLTQGVSTLWATHIVGGELNYRCLGNDRYEIVLRVYRDCCTGQPPFDNPASVGVFDVNNNFILDMRMQPVGNDTLDFGVSDPCIVLPPAVCRNPNLRTICYHTTTYRDTVTLPFIAGGYQLSYQRCCRNATIVNISTPLAVGGTFYTYISEAALLGCNSNPVFPNWPPPLICNNRPFLFDHSAIDLDGDSIVYSLVAPFVGGDTLFPIPQPPNAPPYDTVRWIAPFNRYNMMGGNPRLQIDPRTGSLTATPDILGQFVVGIMATEYRNGQEISVTRRDFQFNIAQCRLLNNAAFFTPEVVCDNGFVVRVNNQSQAQIPQFKWDFGDPTTQADVSALQNPPPYAYPDTGRYVIRLIVGAGSCADTTDSEVYVQYETILANFAPTRGPCADSLVFDFQDQTTLLDPRHRVTSRVWQFGNGRTSTNTLSPQTAYTQSGQYTVTLTSTASNGCVDTATFSFTLNLPNIQIRDSFICQDPSQGITQVTLPVTVSNAASQYLWSPSNSLSSNNILRPVASPTSTTTYRLTATFANSFGPCFLTRQSTIGVVPRISIVTSGDTLVCTGEHPLSISSNLPVNVDWAADYRDGSSISNIGSGNPLVLNPVRSGRFYPTARVEVCSAIDSFDIVVDSIAFTAPTTASATPSCEPPYSLTLNALTPDTFRIAITSYEWQLSDGTRFSGQNIRTSLPNAGGYSVSHIVRLRPGCMGIGRDTFFIPDIRAQIQADSALLRCVGDSITLRATNTRSPAQSITQWIWNIPARLFSASADASTARAIALQGTNNFQVIGINTFGCSDTANVRVRASSISPVFIISSDADTVFVGGQVQLFATPRSNYRYTWARNAPLNDYSISNPSGVLENPTSYYLTVTNEFGCTSEDSILIYTKSFDCGEPFIFVPSAFSPNDDGENDRLFVRSGILTELSFSIYNRWGEKVFETQNQLESWDGNYKGQALPPDAYGWQLKGRCLNGQEYYRKGNVTILR